MLLVSGIAPAGLGQALGRAQGAGLWVEKRVWAELGEGGQETKGLVRGRPWAQCRAGPGQVNALEGGAVRGLSIRRAKAPSLKEPPPFLLLPFSRFSSAFPEMANPQRFLGSSLVAWHGLSLPISQPWHLSLMFRTRQADGVLLQAVTRGRSTITLQVMQGTWECGKPWPGAGCRILQGVGPRWPGRALGEKREVGWVHSVGQYCHLLGIRGISSLSSAHNQAVFGVKEAGQWIGRGY